MKAAFNSEIVTTPSPVARFGEPAPAPNQDPKTFTESLLAQLLPSSEADMPRQATPKNGLSQDPAWHDIGRPVEIAHVPVILSPVPPKLALRSDTPPRDISLASPPRLGNDANPSMGGLSGLSSLQLQTPRNAGQTLPPAHSEVDPAYRWATITVRATIPQAALSLTVPNASLKLAPQAVSTAGLKTHTAAANHGVPAVQTLLPSLIPQTAASSVSSHEAKSAAPIVEPKTQSSLPVAVPSSSQGMLPSDESNSTLMTAPPQPNGGRSAMREDVYQRPNDLQGLNSRPSITTKPATVPLATVLPTATSTSITPAIPITTQKATGSSAAPLPSGLRGTLSNPWDHTESPALHSLPKAPPIEETARSVHETTSQTSSETPAPDSATSTPATSNGTSDQVTNLIESFATTASTPQLEGKPAASCKPTVLPSSQGILPDAGIPIRQAEVSQHLQTTDQSQSQTTADQPAAKVAISQPGQDVLPVPTSFAEHMSPSSDHTVDTSAPGSPQASSTPAAHSTKLAENQAPASPAPPHAVPVINTARLIQNLGQTEMHVGMRSADFGNISITTSATRNLISAQIELDHSDLARTLAVHLPEMQAKLSSNNQTLNLRIDLNGNAPGPGNGTSENNSGGFHDGSQNGHQQRRGAAATPTAVDFMGPRESTSPSAPTIGEVTRTARLDITA